MGEESIAENMDLLIKEYAKNPNGYYQLEEYNASQHEGNFICWDDITVYLKIENERIKEFSYDGNCSSITLAAASFVAEMIPNQPLDEVLQRNYQTLVDQGFVVSPRRRRAAVISLLWIRNAIYQYRNETTRATFEDLLD